MLTFHWSAQEKYLSLSCWSAASPFMFSSRLTDRVQLLILIVRITFGLKKFKQLAGFWLVEPELDLKNLGQDIYTIGLFR
jgi:hypothetical protein